MDSRLQVVMALCRSHPIRKKFIDDELSHGKSNTTSDPISKTDEESYDCLQRASLTGTQRNTTKDAVYVDENDYNNNTWDLYSAIIHFN